MREYRRGRSAETARFRAGKKIDLTVVGPDNPLALGDRRFVSKKWPAHLGTEPEGGAIRVFESFFAEVHGEIWNPYCARGKFCDAAEAKRFATSLGGRCAVKADGLALGKGVLICSESSEADHAIDEILVGKGVWPGRREIGDSGIFGRNRDFAARILRREDGETFSDVTRSQTGTGWRPRLEHRRDGDYSPTPFLTDAELAESGKRFRSWLKGCAEEGIDFRGILYPGVMLTKERTESSGVQRALRRSGNASVFDAIGK